MIRVGIVGCGNISGIYLQNLTELFTNVTVYACGDLDGEKARQAAHRWSVPHIMTLEEMLRCDEIDMILNLTTPRTHYKINKLCLEAGKHVYVEKPLALNYEEGKELVALAKEKDLYLGCAPDTFLGADIQTCRSLIQGGFIGKPVAASAFMMCHGHESWHPSPEFYYDLGGGPLFDMGPYYVTALVTLLGEAKSVCAINGKTFQERTITSQPKFSQKIPVKVDTHVAAVIEFKNGAIATLVTSFDVWNHSMPNLEIYGTLGSLKVPDPNGFGGPVACATFEDNTFKEIPLLSLYSDNSRGLGVSDMAACIESGRTHNASGALALHVLEIMTSIIKSGQEGRRIALESTLPPFTPASREKAKGVLGEN